MAACAGVVRVRVFWSLRNVQSNPVGRLGLVLLMLACLLACLLTRLGCYVWLRLRANFRPSSLELWVGDLPSGRSRFTHTTGVNVDDVGLP